jgi:anti-sigma-K factor RskA
VQKNVSKANCGWLEEEVVDFAMGHLTAEKQAQFAAHLKQCGHCAAVYHEWMMLLSNRDEQQLPSSSVKRRLQRSVMISNWVSSLAGYLRSGKLAAAGGAVALLLLVGVSLYGQESFTDSTAAVKQQLLKERAMVMDPETVLHEATPVNKSNIRGYVWINDDSNEMLFLAEGLDRLEEKDYQVWFIIENNRSKAGVLQWRDGMAHLYFQGGEIRRVENIAISIEPKGGSFIQTGPDAMFVKVKHVKQ